MKLPRPEARRPQETAIALINVVFLMLIFFLVAGTIAPPSAPGVTLAVSTDAPQAPPNVALQIDAEGGLSWQGVPTRMEDFVARYQPREGESLRIGADRALPAEALIDSLGALRAAGITGIVLVTERPAR
ncbi:biopolymer transporter ExbD [Arsenicitalea aurantiaca]|uniref:Biopolymer transporter ExbD n=1 Tax=Arsenicitalea aurantiaca TaxID=1783274 RepID=A0A433XKH8_9HYPH|nr:biopolymer transporter ExbD [Arsenicitalea aurantiaca]RUT34581.1 biopolymer transporter ExbD [Arsenicitalea aurantiaca]